MAIAMSSVVFAGIYMVSHDSDALEEPDYYEKGLSYDVDYNQKENVGLLDEKPFIGLSHDTLTIRFKRTSNKGMLVLRRPSDQSLDQHFAVETDGYTYTLPLSGLKKGQWEVHLNWENQGKHFLEEEKIYIR